MFESLFAHKEEWDGAQHPRGKTVEGTNAGSFAPRDEATGAFSNDLKEATGALPQGTESLDPRQKHSTKEEIYAKAAEAHAELRSWLNEGKGVATQLGYRHMKGGPEHVTDDEFRVQGGMLFIAPLKGEERAREKVEGEYRGDWSRLKDVVRATVAVDSFREMTTFLKSMQSTGIKIEKVKNRFINPTKAGMRDILMNVRFSNGHVGELQLHLKPFLRAKNEGHHHYQITRSLEAKHNFSDYQTWPREDREQYKDLMQRSDSLYSAAWGKIVAESSAANRNAYLNRYSSLGGSKR